MSDGKYIHLGKNPWPILPDTNEAFNKAIIPRQKLKLDNQKYKEFFALENNRLQYNMFGHLNAAAHLFSEAAALNQTKCNWGPLMAKQAIAIMKQNEAIAKGEKRPQVQGMSNDAMAKGKTLLSLARADPYSDRNSLTHKIIGEPGDLFNNIYAGSGRDIFGPEGEELEKLTAAESQERLLVALSKAGYEKTSAVGKAVMGAAATSVGYGWDVLKKIVTGASMLLPAAAAGANLYSGMGGGGVLFFPTYFVILKIYMCARWNVSVIFSWKQ